MPSRLPYYARRLSLLQQKRQVYYFGSTRTLSTVGSLRSSYSSEDTAAEDDSKRHVVKVLLDSLRFAGDLGTRVNQSNRSRTKGFLLDELLKGCHHQQERPSHDEQKASEAIEHPITDVAQTLVTTRGDAPLEADTVIPKKESQPCSISGAESEDGLQETLLVKLKRKIKRRQATEARELFDQIMLSKQRHDPVLPAKITSDLFFLLSQKEQISAYEVLQYYNTHYSDIHGGKWLPMYKRICTAVGSLDLDKSSRKQTYDFVVSLLSEVDEMDAEAKRVLYPSLVISFAKQRRVFLGRFAHKVYDSMVENGFEMKLGWLNKVLSLSRYNRQDDLPFHDILARAVNMGGTPHSSVVLPVIHNMFPYTDTDKMRIALQALVDIETARVRENDRGNYGSHRKDHSRIDVSTVEMISTSAAQMGDASLIVLVWDVLEASGHRPTETIFENTVLAFAANQADGLPQAFVALESMKEYGYKPSRALLRSFSYLIRNELSSVDYALDVLLQSASDNGDDNTGATTDVDKTLLSLESLNVVMSGYAERGETEQTLDLLKLMDRNNIQPNADSFSFAIEVLGKDIHRRKMTDDPSHVHKNLDMADFVLTRMERSGIEPSSFVIRQYIELLCLAGEVDTATTVVETGISEDHDRFTLCNKSLYRVALANTEIGNFEKARQHIGRMSESIAALTRKLTSKETRYRHLQKVASFSSVE